MKIDPYATRTTTNPVHGVTFHADDRKQIEEAAVKLVALDEELIFAIRRSLAREILHLDELANWTSGEAEDVRLFQQKNAMIAHRLRHCDYR